MEVHMTTKDELKASNQSAKFWELEQPEIMETRFNTLRYYPKAQRLVVHLRDYWSERDGCCRMGKGTGLDLAALSNRPDTIDRLIEILQSIKPY